ncbi:MAG: hypothetical protein V1800_14145 [Candidatus Latescibacterota bacterium]
MKRRSRSLLVFSVLFAVLSGGSLILAPDGAAIEYSKASALFLLISPSARINGMGQAGVAVPDEPMGYYNPAAPALNTRGYNLSYVASTERIGWLPPIANGMNYSYSGLQVSADMISLVRSYLRGSEERLPSQQARLLRRLWRDVSVGVALSHYKTERYLSTANNTVISANIRLLADFSAGMTLIDYESQLGYSVGIAKGSAQNYGLMIRLPLVQAFETLSGHSVKLPNGLRPVLESTYGVSWNHRGDGMRYSGLTDPVPLPCNRKTGYGLDLAVNMDYRSTSLDLFRVLIATERERTQTSASEQDDVIDKIGFEQEILETLVLRRGKFNDAPGQPDIRTSGITIKSDGLMKIIANLHADRRNADPGILSYMARHLSIAWHKSTYEIEDTWLDGSEFEQITLSLSF